MNFRTTALAATLCMAFTPAIHAADAGGQDGLTGTPNRSGSSYPTGDDRVTAPSTAKESGPNTTGSSSSDSMSSGSSSGSMSSGSSSGSSDGLSGTPNRSGSGYPTGDDRVTAPSTAKESGANTTGSGDNMSSGSSSGSMSSGSSSSGSMNDPAPGSDASGTASPNRSGSGAPSGSDKPTAPATAPVGR